jgi:gliding motility-associated-like protein
MKTLLLLLSILLSLSIFNEVLAQKFLWAKCEKAVSSPDGYIPPYPTNMQMVYDKLGNVYVIGQLVGEFVFENGVTFDVTFENPWYFAKYDPDGKLLWVKKIFTTQTEENYDSNIFNVLIHSDQDYIYISISGTENVHIDNDKVLSPLPQPGRSYSTALIKYNLDGQIVWKKPLFGIPRIVGNNEESGNIIVKSMDTDTQGNTYLLLEVANHFDLGDGVERISQRRVGFVAVKFNTNGIYQWHLLLNDTATPRFMGSRYSYDQQKLKVNQQGEVYVISLYESGVLIDNQEVTDQFVVLSKISSQGQLIWNQFVDAPNSNYQIYKDPYKYAFLLDSQGNPYLIDDGNGIVELNGGFNLDLGALNMTFMAKFDPNTGKIVGTKVFKNRRSYDFANATIDAQDNFYFTGLFAEQFVIGDKPLWTSDNYSSQIFIFKTNTNGEVIWTHQVVDGNWQNINQPMDIIAQPDGGVYITGSVYGDNIFNCTTLSTRYSTPFLAKIIQSPLHISAAVGMNNQFCQNSNEASLSVKPVPGAKTYVFFFPQGITVPANIVVDGPDSYRFSITHYAPLGIQKVQVLAYDGCAELIAQGTIDLEILPIPTRPTLPQGEAVVCAGKPYTYQVEPISHNEIYEWDLPNGVTPANGTNITNTPQISLIFSKNITEALIAVQGKNTRCGYGLKSAHQYIRVTQEPPQPAPITGLPKICAGQTQVLYKVPELADVQGYIWKLPAGVSINNGTNTTTQPEILLNFATNFQGGNIQVAAKGDCGEGSPSPNFTISITPLPANAQAIQMNGNICQGQAFTLKTAPIAHSVEYVWTLPDGKTQITTLPELSLTLPNQTMQGSFQVAGKNICGQLGNPSPMFSFQVIPQLSATGKIAGVTEVCINTRQQTYAVPAVVGAKNYHWTLPAGVKITAGQNTSQITVDFTAQAQSGDWQVSTDNACFRGLASEKLFVKVVASPPAQLTIKLNCDILEAPTDLPDYQWFRDNQAIQGANQANLLLKQAGKYFLRTQNICGYTDSPIIDFERNKCTTEFILPTAFSPNGDGLNDELAIVGRNFTGLTLWIYNRWGELIFTANRLEDQWDGSFKGKPAPDGVYVWKATFESTVEKGQKIQKSGKITLIR